MNYKEKCKGLIAIYKQLIIDQPGLNRPDSSFVLVIHDLKPEHLETFD